MILVYCGAAIQRNLRDILRGLPETTQCVELNVELCYCPQGAGTLGICHVEVKSLLNICLLHSALPAALLV